MLRWLFGLSLTVGTLFAQSTGSITGRVFDQATGRSLQGAVVHVKGSTASDFTDTEGRFTLSGVPAGAATVEIEYVGLDPMTQAITVAPGEAARLDVGLKSSVLQMQAFEVQEAARGQALAINQQKTAAGIVNIVSEETFGNMLSGNPGYALQRLPGISVDEDQDGSPSGINLRGVPGDYNSFQIDGNRVPNSSGTGRSASMKNIVADGITNIEVIKAATTDKDGDAIGGIINVVSRTAFQRDGREYRLVGSMSYNDLSDTFGYNARATYSDIFSILGKDKNLGISITATKYKTDRYSENVDMDWVFVTPANNPTLGLTNETKFLEAAHSERSSRTTNTYGINASIDFRIDAQNSFYFRPYWSHYDASSETFETDYDVDTRFQDEVGGRKTYAFLSPDGSRGGGTPGANGSRSTLGYIGTDDDSHNDIWSWTVGGRHERDTTLLTYDFNYGTTTYVRPHFVEFNMRLDPIAQGYYVMEYESFNRMRPKFTITNGLSPTEFAYARQGPTNLIIVPRTKEEENYSAKADWEKRFSGDRLSHALKVGAKYRSSKPTYNQEDHRYQIAGNSAAAQVFPFANVTRMSSGMVEALNMPVFMEALPKQALTTLTTAGWTPVEPGSFNGSNLADYTAEETTTAAYLMDSVKFGRHSMIAGIRWEQNDWSRTNKRVISTLPGPVLSTVPVTSGTKYDLWLPGVHFRHELAKNLILRESYNKSYGRPSLNDIARGRSESIATSGVISISEGNPLLQPSDSDNFDVQLEWYNDKGGLYSVALFHKKIKNFTYSQVTRFNALDAEGRPIAAAGGQHTHTQPLNGPGAKNTGVELIARQRLYFLPGPLKGLSADLSATFTDSDAPIPGREADKIPLRGFSDYLFTSSLSYAWGNFRARADYRFRSEYIESLEGSIIEDEWFSAREQVDAEVSYRLGKGMSLFASGTNLTHRPRVAYTGQKVYPEDVEYSGRKYTFGIEYKF